MSETKQRTEIVTNLTDADCHGKFGVGGGEGMYVWDATNLSPTHCDGVHGGGGQLWRYDRYTVSDERVAVAVTRELFMRAPNTSSKSVRDSLSLESWYYLILY